MAGAGGIRANGPEDIREIKKTVKLPMIGIYKLPDARGIKIITPNFAAARELAYAGAEIIAIDATREARTNDDELAEFIYEMKAKLKVLVMADISNLDEGIRAEKAGANLVATTMSGYTSYTKKTEGPDLELIKQLVSAISVPVIGEGRFSNPTEVNQALDLGAHSIVVGTSITAPWEIAARFVRAITS